MSSGPDVLQKPPERRGVSGATRRVRCPRAALRRDLRAPTAPRPTQNLLQRKLLISNVFDDKKTKKPKPPPTPQLNT